MKSPNFCGDFLFGFIYEIFKIFYCNQKNYGFGHFCRAGLPEFVRFPYSRNRRIFDLRYQRYDSLLVRDDIRSCLRCFDSTFGGADRDGYGERHGNLGFYYEFCFNGGIFRDGKLCLYVYSQAQKNDERRNNRAFARSADIYDNNVAFEHFRYAHLPRCGTRSCFQYARTRTFAV